MLDEHTVLENSDLRIAGALVRGLGTRLVPHHHHPVDGLAPGQELGLGQDRGPAPSGVAAVAAALALGLQAGGTGNPLNLVAPLGTRLALVHNGVRRIVIRRAIPVVTASGLATTSPAPAATGTLGSVTVLGIRFVTVGRRRIVPGTVGGVIALGGLATLGCRIVTGVVGAFATALFAASTATATASPPPATCRTIAIALAIGVGIVRLTGVLVDVLGLLGADGRGPFLGLGSLWGHEQWPVVVCGRSSGCRHRHRGGLDDRRLGDEDGRGRRVVGVFCRIGRVAGDDGGRFLGSHRGRCLGDYGSRLRLIGKHLTHLGRVLLVDIGVRAAGAPVQVGQRVEHAACRGSQNARQGMHPQLLGKFSLLSRGRRGVRR
ncbi:Uncharacterised protein [Mycobacteroides abscessus subsp. abscessus]|nr:Uncharacterised protein [Mycobacteroides abscessus subsp. abscessus]